MEKKMKIQRIRWTKLENLAVARALRQLKKEKPSLPFGEAILEAQNLAGLGSDRMRTKFYRGHNKGVHSLFRKVRLLEKTLGEDT